MQKRYKGRSITVRKHTEFPFEFWQGFVNGILVSQGYIFEECVKDCEDYIDHQEGEFKEEEELYNTSL